MRPGPRPQGGGGTAFIVKNGIYVPLQYTNPADPLNGGYGWCDKTDGGMTYHPGADLNSGAGCNADLGSEVVASVGGVVLACLPWDGYTSGEGNHVWVYYDDDRCVAPAYAHFDHLLDFCIAEGERVDAGQLIGHCGNSGNWDCAHTHCELARYQPDSWWQWPYAWPLSSVENAYFDPGWWYEQTAAKAGGMPEDAVRTSTTPEERQAVAPYFATYGITCDMNSAIMQRACLAYYRAESRGPALTAEYPATAPDGTPVTRQTFTAGVCETKQLPDGNVQVGWVETQLPGGG